MHTSRLALFSVTVLPLVTQAFISPSKRVSLTRFSREVSCDVSLPTQLSGEGATDNEDPYGISARDARILAPLTALSTAFLPKVDPARAAFSSGDFDSSRRQYFPLSLSSSKVADRALASLVERGYTRKNTLLAASLCSDEINNTPTTLFGGISKGLAQKNSGGVFNLGGLGGIPFVGPSGFGAFFSHCPRSGNIVIVYGPHVGISASGQVGKIERVGMDKISGACGAALGAYKAIKAEKEKYAGGAPVVVEELERATPYSTAMSDIQEDYIIAELRKKIINEDLNGPDENALVAMVTNRMFDMVAEMLTREVVGAYSKPGFWDNINEVTLLGGIVINRGNAEGADVIQDYFEPITFKCLRRGPMGSVTTDNLLAELYDENRKKPKPLA
mmetsp:Transcript_2528/g.3834  ORF Transcript_2528/g.3834 Transcript_2528/m.3834 type:complete len:389 (-) Transcript_2528:185-1351(-)|eukprot:CAMPEP_0195530380 /NCGR_PEP_ID=MMETSP0794_2-20130614/33231_1 /TAXON_ID=515487 /ORGANISM="Stephanopyxis turris, Strain CCMP 815" /LENGTH=388 /DNA_ID=CAMNT_0040661871 /DNA_START=254 /DNA_END=1420 /DNA_ORIENTATION=+